ncbi:HTH-type transcriptional regulator CysB [Stagnimonas aquatica]|uniref:HTH-type transcriptional regulator CysB n=1 Tax=Stagnimonas aquatica TaxID=2689987 RepID=A0A3N0VLP0_9GAMM|nr:HTH-type transcriptional regulator CysB [Stagnimonas aquatica]ROH93631.1 HTH-type transcriptional regulator CysB [Stagnimonas aquatica]
MKIRQLRYIDEVVRRGLNVTAAAEALYTSQPGVSKQIRLLEEELGLDIFQRHGKHLAQVTPAGQRILDYTARLLAEADNITKVAGEFRDANRGDLAIATTHTQARYALPKVIQAFKQRYPLVSLYMHQGAPPQVAHMAAEGQADFAIATEAIEHQHRLVMLPCYRWNRCALVKRDHPLAASSRLDLRALAQHPLITYTQGFTGRAKLDQAFASQGLHPNVLLTAVDADVIKTYVRLDLGVGIVASIAYDASDDADLVALPVDHLFEPSTTHIGFRRGMFLRGYMTEFIGLFAPHLDRSLIEEIDAIADPELRRLRTATLIPSVPTI